MMCVELRLEVDKDALTDERIEEYKELHDEDWEKEGYLITGELKLEELCIERLGGPALAIRAYNDELYIDIEIPLEVFLTEFLKRNEFVNLIKILEEKKVDIEKMILDLKKLNSCIEDYITK